MAAVSIEGGDLTVEVRGTDRLWALTSRLTIPLQHVRGATVDPGITAEPKGWRGLGTHVPGVIVAGTFHQDGERVFWDVRDPARAVVIELRDDRHQRLVLSVEDPRATVDLVERAISGD